METPTASPKESDVQYMSTYSQQAKGDYQKGPGKIGNLSPSILVCMTRDKSTSNNNDNKNKEIYQIKDACSLVAMIK